MYSEYFLSSLAGPQPGFFMGRCDPTRRRTELGLKGGGGGQGERGVGWLRLHFKRFEKPVISRTFNLQRQCFSNRVLYFTIFQNGNVGCHYFEKKKIYRKKVVNPYYLLDLYHDLSIGCQAQASLGVSQKEINQRLLSDQCMLDSGSV